MDETYIALWPKLRPSKMLFIFEKHFAMPAFVTISGSFTSTMTPFQFGPISVCLETRLTFAVLHRLSNRISRIKCDLFMSRLKTRHVEEWFEEPVQNVGLQICHLVNNVYNSRICLCGILVWSYQSPCRYWLYFRTKNCVCSQCICSF